MAEGGPKESGLCLTVTASLAPGEVREWVVCLPAGATVADALTASAAAGEWEQEAAPAPVCGIWGRAVTPDQVLYQGDRLELYRPLTADPKVARRERFARQGVRTAGLFARQRTEPKAGD